MEYMTPNFTKDMVKTHKILIPNMAVTQFRLMQAALASEGYQTEVLGNCGSEVAQLGLKYVHNDTCYPALLVIGQFLDALNSGKYDLDHTALLITQTGGGCRASNYIKLLRKALVKAGYGNIPVASLNFSGLEKGSGLPLTVPLLRKVIASIFYGDMLVALRSQTHAYENHRGDADAMTEKWISAIQGWIRDDKNYSAHDMKRRFYDIAADYATIPITRVPKVKVGVVGEIYVKYSPLGNNDLEKFLESQDCEVNLPGLMGFVEYCVANYKLDIDLYGGNKLVAGGADAFLSWLDGIGCASYDAMRKYGFYAPGSFRELMKKPEGIISLGAKMGEGWLLTAEMIELVEGGYGNIVCRSPREAGPARRGTACHRGTAGRRRTAGGDGGTIIYKKAAGIIVSGLFIQASSLPPWGKVAPQGRMRGKFTELTRLQAISARLPLISQRSWPLTASLTSPPPVSALPPAYRSPAVLPSASGSAHCSRHCGPHQGGRPAAGGQRGA